MNILAFDTALGACSAAVLVTDGQARLARVFERRERGHAESLMPMIQQAMGEAGVAYTQLDRIAVTVGPGTFTGTRIGVAAARGLALAAGVPLVGVTTLAVMARQALASDGFARTDAIAICVDAHRGQIYFQLFDAMGRGLCSPLAIAPEAAAERLPAGLVTAAGSGARALANAAGAVTARLPDLQPDAGALAQMAVGLEPAAEPLKPLYLRPPDAKPQGNAPVEWLKSHG